MVFAKIAAGELVMGAPLDENGREAQEIQHDVRLSRPFWIGVFEVTQHEWQAVMGSDPSRFRSGDDHLPVDSVTWFDVHAFLERLTKGSPQNGFRLPTEAEWEYACRAGTASAYGSGPTLSHAEANVAEAVERTASGQGTRWPSVRFRRTRGGFTTCTAMSGSGLRTNTVRTPAVELSIRAPVAGAR